MAEIALPFLRFLGSKANNNRRGHAAIPRGFFDRKVHPQTRTRKRVALHEVVVTILTLERGSWARRTTEETPHLHFIVVGVCRTSLDSVPGLTRCSSKYPPG